MVNDTTTLNGALTELGETMADNLVTKGVTGASASDGLTTLAGKILDIQTGGGGATNIVQGTFTTGSTRATTGKITLNYNGSGYPIAFIVYVDGGMNGNTTWANSINNYNDIGVCTMAKAEMNTTPSYTQTVNSFGVVMYIYKNSTTSASLYNGGRSEASYTYAPSTNDAATAQHCVRFCGSGVEMGYYIGNQTSTTRGLAPSTTYAYIVIYSE